MGAGAVLRLYCDTREAVRAFCKEKSALLHQRRVVNGPVDLTKSGHSLFNLWR